MTPPRLATLIVRALVAEPLRDALLGDLEERFQRDASSDLRRASRRYWRQAIGGAWHLRRERPRGARPSHRSIASHMAGQMSTLTQDLRLAVRALRRSPAYAAISIFTLALAIGANTLIFSIANPLVVRALPVADPNGLGWIWLQNTPRAITRGSLSAPEFLDLRARARSFSSLAASETGHATLTGHQQDAERVTIYRVTPNLTDVWGEHAALGRLFAPGDDAPDRIPPVILSTRFWQQRFHGDPGIVGRQFFLDGRSTVVVGVMPASLELGNLALIDLWTVAQLDATAPRTARTLRVMGRLAPGATVASAATEVAALVRQMAAANPADDQNWTATVVSTKTAVLGTNTALVLTLLAIVVGFVLLIACANLSNLVLTRLTARSLDLAIRQALGASRWQMVRTLLIEALLLSAVGGVLALGIAQGGLKLIRAVAYEPIFQQLSIDGNVLAFASLLTMTAPLIFCLLPGLTSRRAVRIEALRDTRSSGGRTANRQRGVLVAAQVALSLSLLIVSTLAVRSMRYLQDIPLGLDLDRVAMFRFELPTDQFPADDDAARFDAKLEAALAGGGDGATASAAGVTRAAVATHLPVFDGEISRSIDGLAKPFPESAHPWASWYGVSPGFFDTVGIAVLKGRGFSDADRAGAEPVAVLSATAASRYFDDAAAVIGSRVRVGDGRNGTRQVTIVGVVSDTRSPVVTVVSPQMYVPLAQWPQRDVVALARAADPAARLADLRAVMRSLAPLVPVTELRTLADKQRDEMSSNQILNGLFISFSLVALALAAGGLYGVVSYTVGQRSREIGVRLALGAAPAGIRRLVLGDGLKVTLAGAAGGLVLGVAMATLASPILEGVSATDPATFIVATLGVIAVALGSILGPAMRAMRTDPAKTLRD